MIGVVLAFVTPKIQEYQDKAIIEQTIDSFNILDKKINEVLSAPLNTRIVEFQLKKGKVYFDPASNEISFILFSISKTRETADTFNNCHFYSRCTLRHYRVHPHFLSPPATVYRFVGEPTAYQQ